jgi:hypothetical protein
VTILILGSALDPFCALLEEEFVRRCVPSVFLNEAELVGRLRVLWHPGDPTFPATLGTDPTAVRLAEVSGVFFRFAGALGFPEKFAPRDQQYVTSELVALFCALVQELPCPVVNRPRHELWFKGWIPEAELASLSTTGTFCFRRAIITSDPDAAATFFREHGEMVFLPLSAPIPYPIRTQRDLHRLHRLMRTIPVRLVEAVEGEEFDCYVVGPRTFVASRSEGEPWPLPDAIRAECVRLAEHLGLAFAQFRFLRGRGGEVFALGMEPYPTFPAQDIALASELVGALADELQRDTG